jgi:glycosyltransferase involved in cell wall biosynthesis
VKIVHVTLRFDAPGGVETNVREITRRLKAAGHDVEVFASDLYDESTWERRSNFRPTVDGVPVRRFRVFKRPLPRFTLPMMAGLIDALAESGADVIHAHSHRYGHLLQAAAVSRRHGIPLVISTHYHPADRRESRWKRGLLRVEDVAFGASAYREARVLVAQSELEARMVGEFSPRSKIRVIPPGVDVGEWQDPASDRTDGLSLPPDYVLFVGRLASNKGLPFLFEALGRLRPPERPPLVLMGPDWGERTSLEVRARELGVFESVHWLGRVEPRAAYRGVIRGARALVLPSEWEAFGLVLLDAMAARTPVVATEVGAVPEVLDHGRAGRLVPYGDTAALAEALRRVRAEPGETQRLVDQATERVRGLDWSESARRLGELYRSLRDGTDATSAAA